MDARKLDTRRKIQLGGLIVKAGLAEEPAAVPLKSWNYGNLQFIANSRTSAEPSAGAMNVRMQGTESMP